MKIAKSLAYLALFIVSGGQVYSDGSKRVVEIKLPVDTERALSDVRLLSNFDVMGIDHDRHIVQVNAAGSEIAKITALGFEVSFASQGGNAYIWPFPEPIEKYLSADRVVSLLEETNKQYPDITKLTEIGKTHRGRKIMGITLSSSPDDTSKPAVLFNSMHHAREVMTTEVAAHIVKVLTEGYGKDPEVTHWLDSYRVIVVPQVNPDGNTFVHEGKRMWRKNAWEKDSKAVGVDLNRNYPTYWDHCNGSSGSTGNDAYRGPSPASEPETKAMMDLVRSTKPVMNISYHAFSELIIYPFGCATVTNSSMSLFDSIGKSMNAEVVNDSGKKNSYRVGTAPQVIYEADGTDIDWQWKEEGVVAFAFEVNSMMAGFQPNYEKWRDKTVVRQEGAWKQMLRRMDKGGVRGFVKTEGTNISDLTYTISVKDDSAPTTRFLSWAGDSGVAPFKARNSSGLIYQLLDKGTYRIHFFSKGEPVKEMDVEVENGMVDLGSLAL